MTKLQEGPPIALLHHRLGRMDKARERPDDLNQSERKALRSTGLNTLRLLPEFELDFLERELVEVNPQLLGLLYFAFANGLDAQYIEGSQSSLEQAEDNLNMLGLWAIGGIHYDQIGKRVQAPPSSKQNVGRRVKSTLYRIADLARDVGASVDQESLFPARRSRIDVICSLIIQGQPFWKLVRELKLSRNEIDKIRSKLKTEDPSIVATTYVERPHYRERAESLRNIRSRTRAAEILASLSDTACLRESRRDNSALIKLSSLFPGLNPRRIPNLAHNLRNLGFPIRIVARIIKSGRHKGEVQRYYIVPVGLERQVESTGNRMLQT